LTLVSLLKKMVAREPVFAYICTSDPS